jgi:hypothetical protein
VAGESSRYMRALFLVVGLPERMPYFNGPLIRMTNLKGRFYFHNVTYQNHWNNESFHTFSFGAYND